MDEEFMVECQLFFEARTQEESIALSEKFRDFLLVHAESIPYLVDMRLPQDEDEGEEDES